MQILDVLVCGDISRSFWEGLLTIPGGANGVCGVCVSMFPLALQGDGAVNHQPVK